MATVTSQLREKTTTTLTTRTIKSYFEEADESIPYRLVGSYEYTKAIELLGTLVEKSTKEQVNVYDRLLQGRPEFSFYSGFALNEGLPGTFNQQTQNQSVNHHKNSLAWLLALAKVEVGATVSMYGNSNQPFEDVASSNFGHEEFLAVLLDDLAFHIQVGQQDEDFENAGSRKSIVDGSSLVYLRRAVLMNDMLQTLLYSNHSFAVDSVRPYEHGIQEYVDKLTRKIVRATKSYSAVATEQSTETMESTSGVRYKNRRNLLNCQRQVERVYNDHGFGLEH